MCSDKSQFKSEVVSTIRLSHEHFRITLNLPDDMRADPGQFFNLKTGGKPQPLWRRPFSAFDQHDSTVEFYIRVVGKGTRWLADIKPGAAIDILGPLGNGFDLPEPGEKCLLVAGGVGIAPLHFLSKRLKEAGNEVTVLWGGANARAIEIGDDIDLTPLKTATLDGSLGQKGLITDLLKQVLTEGDLPDRLYSCGPEAMLKEVVNICIGEKVPVRISFESKMACGWGVCLGCPVLVKDDEGDQSYKRVCRDGPVFWGQNIIFER